MKISEKKKNTPNKQKITLTLNFERMIFVQINTLIQISSAMR